MILLLSNIPLLYLKPLKGEMLIKVRCSSENNALMNLSNFLNLYFDQEKHHLCNDQLDNIHKEYRINVNSFAKNARLIMLFLDIIIFQSKLNTRNTIKSSFIILLQLSKI